jgi:hypothetical protein
MLIEIKFRIVRSLQRSEIVLKIFRFDILDNIFNGKTEINGRPCSGGAIC